MTKATLNKTIFTNKLRLNIRTKLDMRSVGAWLCMVLEIGHFGK